MKRKCTLTESQDRREFLGALGFASVASFAPGLKPTREQGTITNGALSSVSQSSEYLFAPGLVYFGTATLGPCSRKVLEATMRAWHELESNPTAMGYGDGPTLAAAERTRSQAAGLLGCAVDEIAITRSTSDGMNAIAQGLGLTAGDRVLTSDQEHEGGSMCWQYLAHRGGIGIDVISIPPGENDVGAVLDRLRAAITPHTRVISVSHVLASTGLRLPIAEISALARSRGIWCVVDGAQAVGEIEVNVMALGCHAYATSGHKWIMAPKGTGLLYLSSETKESIQPIQFEDGRAFYNESTGVGNLPGVVGLGVALESLQQTGIANIEQHNLQLRNRIHEGLAALGVGRVVSPAPGPLATALITLELPARIESEQIFRTLREKHRIQVKLVPKRWLNGIRLSPHIFNTSDEVSAFQMALRRELT